MLQARAIAQHSSTVGPIEVRDPVAAVKAVLDRADAELDYARAKLAFDSIVDPSIDAEAVLAELGRMAATARELAGPAPSDAARLAALRKLIYESGPWNGGRPFEYDHSDPLGRLIRNKLLHNYLATRRGQCVSMPVLFLILAERVGLDMALGSAPEHVFLRYTAPGGRVLNLEATSGAHPARDEWYRQNYPISDRAVASGLYLRTLTKREGVALVATTVMEHVFEQGRFEEAIALCKVILKHSPRNAQTMVAQGSVYGELLERFRQKYPMPGTAPLAQVACAFMCMERNMSLFAAAERLGWAPFEEERK